MLSSTTDFPTPIITPRLILRPPTTSAKNINIYRKAVAESIDTLKLWLPWAKSIPTSEQIETYIEMCDLNWIVKNDNNIGLPLWIIDKHSGKFLGNITMWNIVWNVPKFEFGFWIRNSQTKKGYMKETVNALSHYCFLELGVRRIEVRCELNNIPPQTVAKHLGFELDAVLKNSTRAIANNTLTDTMLFSLTDVEKSPDLEVKW